MRLKCFIRKLPFFGNNSVFYVNIFTIILKTWDLQVLRVWHQIFNPFDWLQTATHSGFTVASCRQHTCFLFVSKAEARNQQDVAQTESNPNWLWLMLDDVTDHSDHGLHLDVQYDTCHHYEMKTDYGFCNWLCPDLTDRFRPTSPQVSAN